MATDNEEYKKIIENTIETKFNQLLETIPKFINKEERKDKDDFFNISILDVYRNTIQTIIDIINDLTHLFDITKNYDNIFRKILRILFKNDRMFYIGIILIILSFIIYFIDGASI
jgi:hypothetical protein